MPVQADDIKDLVGLDFEVILVPKKMRLLTPVAIETQAVMFHLGLVENVDIKYTDEGSSIMACQRGDRGVFKIEKAYFQEHSNGGSRNKDKYNSVLAYSQSRKVKTRKREYERMTPFQQVLTEGDPTLVDLVLEGSVGEHYKVTARVPREKIATNDIEKIMYTLGFHCGIHEKPESAYAEYESGECDRIVFAFNIASVCGVTFFTQYLKDSELTSMANVKRVNLNEFTLLSFPYNRDLALSHIQTLASRGAVFPRQGEPTNED